MVNSEKSIEAGQAVYTPLTLAVYDWFVLGFSNRFLWRCPTKHLEAMYNRNVSDSHLDIGVGTGYFLDKTTWPSVSSKIVLSDLNPHSLDAAANRIARYAPTKVKANIFETLPIDQKFTSIGLCYLLHCLPGAMAEKAPVVFRNVRSVLADNGRVFGATILQGDAPRSGPAQALMNTYNRKGIFSNSNDTAQDLDKALRETFSDVKILRHGAVAIFEATGS